MYIKRLLKKRLMISSITIMLLVITLISSSYAIFMDSKTDIKEQVLTVGDLLITYNGSSAINSNGITPITNEQAYQKIDNIYTFTIKNEGLVPYKYKIYLEDNPSFLDRNLLNHNYIRYDLNNEGTGILGEKEGGIIFEGILKGNTTKEYTLRLWVGIEGLPNEAIGSEIHLNIMVDGRAEDGEEIKVLKDAILAQGGGAEAIIARGNPDFSKASPEVLSYEEGLFLNQNVRIQSSTSGNRTIGTGYTYNNETRKYTLTGTSTSQTYNENAIGKYTCDTLSTICGVMYKILEVELSTIGTNYSQDDGTTYTASMSSASNKMVSTSYTFDGSTGRYNLSGTKYPSVSYSSSYINYYTCNDNTGTNCSFLYKINTVSGTAITNITRYYYIQNYNYATKADLYQAKAISTTEDHGIYATQDEYGTSYYYRGSKDLLNNNLIFGGFQWKIVRINGDESIRLIYNGACSGNPCVINSFGAAAQIPGEHVWNMNINDIKYAGYMYGGLPGVSSTSRAEATTNQTNSNAKTVLDNWYINNILNQEINITNGIVDNIFCNDRQLQSEVGGPATGPGYGGEFSNAGEYAPGHRLLTERKPKLMCGLKNDRFSVNDVVIGNGALTYPVGLISADEAAMAGMINLYSIDYVTNYLNSGNSYWTFSPVGYYGADNRNAYVFVINGDDSYGNNIWGPVQENFGIRPVLSIKGDLKVTGTGSLDDPFVIIE